MIIDGGRKELKDQNIEIQNARQTTEMRGLLQMWNNSLWTNNRNIDQWFCKGEKRGKAGSVALLKVKSLFQNRKKTKRLFYLV